MKYRRKTPVDAIQWTGHNREEIHEFIVYVAKYCCSKADKSGSLIIVYKDHRDRTFKTVIPELGWVVRDGKTFQFYKDSTFRKTFEEVLEDDNKGVDWDAMSKTIHKAFDSFDDVFKGFNHVSVAEPSKETLDEIKIGARTESDGRLFKIADDVYRNDDKMREEFKKQLSEGLNGMAGSDTNKATFESVLDEMKELHAKKDKDYGSAFHKSFEEFGVTSGVVRLNDKMERAKALVKNGKAEVKDDSLLDSLKDLGCYAVMLYVELKNKENGTDKD